ncbi:hypothetical protein GDO81_004603 [Engystomops pustulosus]|uniref:Uncharacterized protein n=1 Tax=Engystomops pustulosus TaxID=76066 RepID=A0AAV7A106_ENGPU|nr:hypothetical protein GDO81_021166 [Engystomops pustulosus]KAG8552606.1 hypothetical protein GDO81_004602 [Engystomops pustulosus]KAG8552607.1 hypothetical protein GDO81_004603 [Engystomops pustulosus]
MGLLGPETVGSGSCQFLHWAAPVDLVQAMELGASVYLIVYLCIFLHFSSFVPMFCYTMQHVFCRHPLHIFPWIF